MPCVQVTNPTAVDCKKSQLRAQVSAELVYTPATTRHRAAGTVVSTQINQQGGRRGGGSIVQG
jgi:hypothetical protein